MTEAQDRQDRKKEVAFSSLSGVVCTGAQQYQLNQSLRKKFN